MHVLKERIERINNDRQSGSTGILEQCHDMLSDYLENNPSPNLGEILESLRSIFRVHANMAVLFHFCNACFLEIEKIKQAGKERDSGMILSDFLEKYAQTWSRLEEKILAHLQDQYDIRNKNILLHSNSGMIIKVLTRFASKGILPGIYQTVSWPAEEGRIQARKLAELGFSIRMISDTAITNFAKDIDLALFGCDAIYPEHFVNKTGTACYSQFLKSRDKKVYVLSDSRKLIGTENMPDNLYRKLSIEKPRNPAEIWQDPPEGISPMNYYFEPVPNKFVSSFILENGCFEPGKLDHLFEDSGVSELFKFGSD